jgi:hypothetical protein
MAFWRLLLTGAAFALIIAVIAGSSAFSARDNGPKFPVAIPLAHHP